MVFCFFEQMCNIILIVDTYSEIPRCVKKLCFLPDIYLHYTKQNSKMTSNEIMIFWYYCVYVIYVNID